jgi:choline dehydrogenase
MARREVLLCAGAFGSPQILELSGIGAAARLQALGIAVVSDSPGVGEALQDHLQVRAVFRAQRAQTINDDVMHPMRLARMGLRYLLARRGGMTISAGYAGGFFRTEAHSPTPDTQLLYIPFSMPKTGAGLDRFSGFTISGCQLRPESRGSVHIASTDPAMPPIIIANYMASEADQQAAVRCLKLIRGIASQFPLASEIAGEVLPGEGRQSDIDLLDFARATAASLYHPTCTVRMGGDAAAPLDPSFRLRGVTGLRVIDGSAMPDLVSGNTNAPIIMMAEKAADMIKQPHDLRSPLA